MKGKEIINHAVRAEMPDREQVKENILRQSVSVKQDRKRPIYRRSAVTLATAAVLVLCFIFGNMLMNPQSDNVFILKAYAMEQQADGPNELREVDLTNQSPIWGGYLDNGILYLNVILKCEGENIKNVEFFTEDGFFAKQKENLYIEEGKAIDNYVSKLEELDDGTIHITWYGGHDFEKIGSNLTLDGETINDHLLYLGTEWIDMSKSGQPPYSTITVNAVVAFNDGKQQEETLVIEFAYTGISF